jgi:AmiR/NasT family two-component response regulator
MALRVLIVEDEMLLALDLEDMLTDAGHSVVGQASDMPQAIALAEKMEGGIDVAIMDLSWLWNQHLVVALRRTTELFVRKGTDEHPGTFIR